MIRPRYLPTSRRILVVLLLSAILSTQILAQPSIFGHWSGEQILAGWSDYFAEVGISAAAMLLAYTVIEATTPRKTHPRAVAIAIALPLAAAGGYALAMALVQPAGFAPGPSQFIGDALRLSLMGIAVALIHSLRRREMESTRRARETELSRHALAGRELEARLRLMEAQIEPHFLFNTLANVQRLLETGSASGIQLLENLKVYLRAALPQMRESRSTLGREAEFARAYLEILQARMAQRLQFSFEIPAELRQRAFPPMMLITLVENAVKHGIAPSPRGGLIVVRCRLAATTILVEVVDDGVGLASGGCGRGIGLSNVRARLDAAYGSAARLSLDSNEPRGVIAQIEVPA